MRYLLALVLLTACTTGAAPEGQDLTGTVTLHAREGTVFAGSNCAGAGGYDDIAQGMGLTLRDGGGESHRHVSARGRDSGGGSCGLPVRLHLRGRAESGLLRARYRAWRADLLTLGS